MYCNDSGKCSQYISNRIPWSILDSSGTRTYVSGIIRRGTTILRGKNIGEKKLINCVTVKKNLCKLFSTLNFLVHNTITCRQIIRSKYIMSYFCMYLAACV